MELRGFSHEAFKEARIAKGWNKSQLADQIGVSRNAISLIEQGVNNPKIETLHAAAEKLDVTTAFFMKDPLPDLNLSTPIFYRDLKSSDVADKEAAAKKAKWGFRAFNFLSQFIKTPARNIPDFHSQDGFDHLKISEDDIETYAEEARKFWGLGPGPIQNLMLLLEKNGVVTVQIKIPEKINAFSFYAEGYATIICSSSVTAVRNRFNLAHEISHLMLHASLDQQELDTQHDMIEDQANRFAGAFLLPRKTFCEEFYSTHPNHLIELKKRWGVAISTILRRAFDLGLISAEERQGIHRRLGGIRKKEPLDDQIMIERPSLLSKGLEAIIEKRLTTKGDIEHKFRIGKNHLSEIFSVGHDFFAEDSVTNIVQFRRS